MQLLTTRAVLLLFFTPLFLEASAATAPPISITSSKGAATSLPPETIPVKDLKKGLSALNQELLENYALATWKKEATHWNREAVYSRLMGELQARWHPSDSIHFEEAKRFYLRFLEGASDLHLKIRFRDDRLHFLPLILKTRHEEGGLAITIEGFLEKSGEQLVRAKALDRGSLHKGDRLLTIEGLAPLDYLVEKQLAFPNRAKKRPEDELERTCPFMTVRFGSLHPLPEVGSKIRMRFARGEQEWEASLRWEQLFASHQKRPKPSLCQIDRSPPPPQELLDLLSSLELQNHGLESDFRSAERAIAILPITRFKLPPLETLEELSAQIQLLKKRARLLILDLRGNGGGEERALFFWLSLIASKPLLMPTKLVLYSPWVKAFSQERLALIPRLLKEEKVPTARDTKTYRREALLERCFAEDLLLAKLEQQKGRKAQIRGASPIYEIPLGAFPSFDPSSFFYRSSQGAPVEETPQPNIVLLLDARSASCAELFAATLRDNGQALLVGERTAGAGGSYLEKSFAPHAGIESLSITNSLVLRQTSHNPLLQRQPIEDFGLEPDVYWREKSSRSSIFL